MAVRPCTAGHLEFSKVVFFKNGEIPSLEFSLTRSEHGHLEFFKVASSD